MDVVGLDLHGFIVTHALRSGGMGHVYEAKHPLIGQRVAVKVLRDELSADPDINARFLREARAMSAVKHRNVVEIHNFGQLPTGAAYLTMELIEGETLSEIITREAPMDCVRALRLSEEILAGLAAAHAVGVVHRDLKPGNIVLMRDSSGDLAVKVLDFGLARHLDTTEPSPDASGFREQRSSLVAGTPEYISPEQATGKAVDGNGDLYAFGVILFEMLTGHLPFESDSGEALLQLHASAVPPRVSTHLPNVHPQLDAFVDRLLSKAPAVRAESARAARAEVQRLEAVIAAMPLVVTPLLGPLVRMLPAPPKPRSSRRAAGLALVGATMAMLTWGLFSFADNRAAAETQPSFTAPPQVEAAATPEAEPADPVAVEPPPPELEALLPVALEPVALEPVAVRKAPPAQKARARSRRSRCEVNDGWRLRLNQQLEQLEQLSIAAIPDTAHPSRVANVKDKARKLADAVKMAEGSGCAQVEAQVFAWKAALQ